MSIVIPSKSPAKLKDVAQDAGVSVATVSLALRDHASISEVTRNRVIESKQRLGYERLRQRKLTPPESGDAPAVKPGLLYCIVDYPIGKEVYSGFLEGVMNACREHNIRLQLTSDTAAPSFQIDTSKDTDLKGVILTGCVTPAVIDYYSSRGLKVVVLGNYGVSNVHTVEIDSFHAGKVMAKRVVEDGHTNIAYLLQNPDNYFEREYLMGIRDELNAHGKELSPSRTVMASETLPSLSEAARTLVNCTPRPTCVISVSPTVAEGCLGEIHTHAALEANQIPRFYSLGQGKKPLNPHLSLLDITSERCGYLAVMKLCQSIAQKEDIIYATVLRVEKWIS